MMVPDLDMYVPGLRWRQGEYQALLRLSEHAKGRVVPLITIPTIEFDFEERATKHTVQEHVASFQKRYQDKWGDRPAWIDIDASLLDASLSSGLPVITHVFQELKKAKARAVPIASLDLPANVVAQIALICASGGLGVGIRVRLEHLMLGNFAQRFATLMRGLKVSVIETDLIIDLGTPAYEPYAAFSAALIPAFSKITGLEDYRSFVVMGTAFPDSLKEVARPGGLVERHDWKFYNHLLKALPASMRRPAFGDYTIVHPTFVANMDMRKLKPAGKLVYTADGNWMIRKGGAFRNNPKQMHDHCEHVVKSGNFKGAGYSEGDSYIDLCAQKKVGCSTMTRWKEIGISHHIMHVLEDVSSPSGPP